MLLLSVLYNVGKRSTAAVSFETLRNAGEGCVKETTMTIGELVATVQTMDPNRDVFVALFKTDGTAEVFDIDSVQDNDGHAQLDISTEEAAEAEVDGRATPEANEGTAEAAEAATNAFLDFCERRGITNEEKDLIWNAMAFICYEQVRERHGAFYEAIKPLLAEGEAE
jgi:hypothetical protein